MVSGDNKTPLPRKEFPSPLRDDKSGGDGGSENDNLRNQNPGYFRRFMNLLVPSNLFSYKNTGWEEVHEIARVQVKGEELEQQHKIMRALRDEMSHTSHLNWEELRKKREAVERVTTAFKVYVEDEDERNGLEAELSIKTEGSIFREGWGKFFRSYKKPFFLATGLVFCFLGVYMAKGGVGVTARFNPSLSSMNQVIVAARFDEACCEIPSLIRETSSSNICHPWQLLHKAVRKKFVNYEDSLNGIVVRPSLEKKLQEVSKVTANTKKNKGLYRNLHFYGPPGTGKKMFVKSLAKHCGMDYGIMNGEDIICAGKEGVTAMQKVFDWAETFRGGLLLFVDEADAFLCKRNKEKISKDLKSTLNAFRRRTGEPSQKCMLVLASNQSDQFDWAINDRLDEVIEFGLPTLEERVRLVEHYFKEYVSEPATSGLRSSVSVIVNFDPGKKFQQLAEVTEGLSAREISKIATAWQASAYGSPDGVLTEDMMDERVEEAVRQHKQKVEWHQAEPSTETTASTTTTEKDKAGEKLI